MIEWPEYDYDYRELPGVCWLSKGIELYSACVEGLFRTSQTLHLSGKSNNSVSLHIAQHDRPFHKQNAMNICTKFKTVFLFFSSYEYIFFRGHHKVEEACEMYCRAANMFKMAKNWSGAMN